MSQGQQAFSKFSTVESLEVRIDNLKLISTADRLD